jgi:hypothetical protein
MENKSRPEKATEGGNIEKASGKKRYVPPTLRRLGTVRELTLSGGTTVADGSRSKKHM